VLHHLVQIGCKAEIIIISGSDKAVSDELVSLGTWLGLNVCAIPKPINLSTLRETLAHSHGCAQVDSVAHHVTRALLALDSGIRASGLSRHCGQ
jgi:hypothetical protein